MDEQNRRLTGRLISRRSLLAGAGASVAVLVAACAGPAAPTAVPSAPTQAPAATAAPAPTTAPATAAAATTAGAVTLKAWQGDWGDLFNKLMMKIGDEFTAANPNIKVEWQFISNYNEKLLTSIAGGDTCDAAYLATDDATTFAFKGILLPLDDQLKSAGLAPADFVQAMYHAAVWQGKLFSIPGGADFRGVFWNKGMYKAAGLDPEQPPKTYKDWEAHSEALLKKDASGNIQQMGFTGGGFQWIAPLYGGKFWDESTQKITATDPGVVAALEWVTNYVKKVDVNKIAAFTTGQPSYSKPGSPFGTNKQAYLYPMGFWAYDPLNKYAPQMDYGVAPLPSLNGTKDEMKNCFVNGWNWGIPKLGKQPDAAWKFIKFSFIDNSAKMGYLTLNGPCVLKQFPDFVSKMSDVTGSKDRITKYLQTFMDIGAAAQTYWPAIPVGTFYADQISRAYDAATHGTKTPQQALQDAQTATEAELQKALTG
jgi:multiple sugar transport system substrate-binding protein